jgi:hypothetical protein
MPRSEHFKPTASVVETQNFVFLEPSRGICAGLLQDVCACFENGCRSTRQSVCSAFSTNLQPAFRSQLVTEQPRCLDYVGCFLKQAVMLSAVPPDTEGEPGHPTLRMYPFCSNVLREVRMDSRLGGCRQIACGMHVAQLLTGSVFARCGRV